MTEGRTFEILGLSEARLAAVQALGWERPTPIQWQAIPAALEGKDVVGIAQTGTGKTGGFMIPALEGVRAGGGLQILVLCPTRELAQQVSDDTLSLAVGTNIRCTAIYGGVGYGPQLDALQQGWEVIVATPGRFIDHMGRGRVDFSNIRFLVLDEADRMLDMGFRPDIEKVLRVLPKKRQTMLFSATMPNGVHDLALRITQDALWVEAARSGTMAAGITELVQSVKPEKKPDLLVHLLQHEGWDHVLVFTRTKVGADVLVGRLCRGGDQGRRDAFRPADEASYAGAGGLHHRKSTGAGGDRHRAAWAGRRGHYPRRQLRRPRWTLRTTCTGLGGPRAPGPLATP